MKSCKSFLFKIENGSMEERQRRRDLKMYYGLENGEPEVDNSAQHAMINSTDPCNLDGASFQPQTYLSKLIQVRAMYCS